MLYIIEDDSALPARYGALAAAFARQTGAALAHLPATFDLVRFPDAVQHVTCDGTLVPSGLLWAERLLDRPVRAPIEPAALVVAAAREPTVVPWHRGVNATATSVATLRALASRGGLATRHYRVVARGDGERLIDADTGLDVAAMPTYAQDRFGRWHAAGRASARHGSGIAPSGDNAPYDASDNAPANAPANASDGATGKASVAARPARIALIGSEDEQRSGYPATLAALGDAIDHASLRIDVRFVAAQSLTSDNATTLLADVDGLLLPGGADMSRVAGQIAAARHGLLSGSPTVGLCLGMQTMATAAARLATGRDDIGLAEVDATVALPSFIPIDDTPDRAAMRQRPVTSLPHRLGLQVMCADPTSRLPAALRQVRAVRYNHRYCLNGRLFPTLAAAGIDIGAWNADRTIADAIVARDHPFFIGMQGHPELSSTSAAPHPLLRAFVTAVARAVGIRR